MRKELVLGDPRAVRVLLDPTRARVFELLRTPRSVPQLAGEVGMPADRLYYHVHRLADAGLIEEAGTRTTGRHTERMFARTAERIRYAGDLALEGLRPLRAFTEELDAGLVSATSADLASVTYHAGGLTEERAAELAERMRALVAEYEDPDPPAGSRRFGILAVVAPLVAETTDPVTIRDMRPDEIGFLREMLYAALAWRPDVQLPPVEWVLAHPQVAVFHEGWGRDGDTALVAERDGRAVGLVWYRFFTDASHGEGYVDDATPELAIAVVDEHRGQGIGRRLLLAAHARARGDGVARLSLSVDPDNPAKRLYASVGYHDYLPGDDLGRMIVDIAARQAHGAARPRG